MDKALLKKLPPAARHKFEALERAWRRASAAARATNEDLAGVVEQRHHIISVVRSHNPSRTKEDVAKQPEVIELQERIEFLRGIYEEASAAAAVASAPVHGCENWLNEMARGGARFALAEPIAVRTTGSAARAIEDIRAEIGRLEEEYRAAENAPAPLVDLKARAVAAIDALAEQGKPHLYSSSRIGDPVGIAERLELVSIGPSLDGVAQARMMPMSANFLAWALRDVLVERVGNLISTLPNDGALADEQREERLRDVAAKKLHAERIEEALVERSGGAITRRPDADPRAILGIVDA